MMTDSKMSKIELTPRIYTALEQSITAEILLETIREKRRSVSKLSEECGLTERRLPDNYNDTTIGIHSFQPRFELVQYNQLKEFLFTNKQLHFMASQMENLAQRLEVWELHPLTGEEIYGRPDPTRIFPKNRATVIKECINREYLLPEDARKLRYFLTRKGSKLPKVMASIHAPQIDESTTLTS